MAGIYAKLEQKGQVNSKNQTPGIVPLTFTIFLSCSSHCTSGNNAELPVESLSSSLAQGHHSTVKDYVVYLFKFCFVCNAQRCQHSSSVFPFKKRKRKKMKVPEKERNSMWFKAQIVNFQWGCSCHTLNVTPESSSVLHGRQWERERASERSSGCISLWFILQRWKV